jgi:two-component system response regulator MprA
MVARVLVVDDDPAVRRSLSRALGLEGYRVDVASDGREALRAIEVATPDSIVLDMVMPGISGLEVCRRLRAVGDQTPILMLTARGDVHDRVQGLDAGADDYLAKPFALEELVARLRAIVRRARADGHDQTLRFDDLELDRATHEVWRAHRPIELTRTEFELLELFLLHPRQVLTRDVIIDHVWRDEIAPDSNAVDVFVGYLRRKIEASGKPRLIQTIRGVGFALRQP